MSFKTPEIPGSVGRCADLYHDVRSLRLAMEKEVAEVEAFERHLREHIIANLSKSDDTGAAGLRYRAQIVTKRKASVTDWGALQRHVLATGEFDLLQRRVSDKAVAERWEQDQTIAGVEPVNVIDVSITKL